MSKDSRSNNDESSLFNDFNSEINSKFKFIKDCIKKVQDRETSEKQIFNDMKEEEKQYLIKIDELKNEINDLTKKIDGVKITKIEVDRKIRNKEVFLNKKLTKNADGNEEMDDSNDDISQKNTELKEEINSINNEMQKLEEGIKIMTEESLEIYQDIENLKKNCDDLVRNNLNLKKTIIRKEKELAKADLEIKKINDKIYQQEKNSESFLKEIEKWANKESSVKNSNIY
jgi:chromosome segregation ATPase